MEQPAIEVSLADYVSDDLKPYVETPEKGGDGRYFTVGYKDQLFLLWYKSGKPMAPSFFAICPPDPNGKRPNRNTIQGWVKNEWRIRAHELDAQVNNEIEKRIIVEKVEMLTRHAKIGKEMQVMAIDWLEENVDQLTAASAVRLLDTGLRVERESRGVPAMLEGIMNMTDEELLEQLKKEIGKSKVEIEMLED